MKTKRPFMAPRIPNVEGVSPEIYVSKIEKIVNRYSNHPKKMFNEKNVLYIHRIFKEFTDALLVKKVLKCEGDCKKKAYDLFLTLGNLAEQTDPYLPKGQHYKIQGEENVS